MTGVPAGEILRSMKLSTLLLLHSVLVFSPGVVIAQVGSTVRVTDGTTTMTAQRLNFTSGCTLTQSGRTANLACSGSGGVSSVTCSVPLVCSGTSPASFSHAASGVAAGTYGTATDVPVCAFNATGHATSCLNTPIAISASQVTSGQVAVARGGTGASTATANLVFAGPTSGGAAAPSFRALGSSDFPTLLSSYVQATPFVTSGLGVATVVAQISLPAGVNGDAALVEVRGIAGSTVAASERGYVAAAALFYNGGWTLGASGPQAFVALGGSVATFDVDISGGNVRLVISDGGQAHRVSGAIGIRFAQ